MAEIVCSALASEAARKLSMCISGEDGDCGSQDKAERFELALIKLESIVAISQDWVITHPPLLQWKAKIKRVSKEGKGRLRAHKKQLKRSRAGNSIRQRMAQVAKRFMPFSYGDDEDLLSMATVKRFERLADGAEEFLKFVELSSRHHKKFVFFPSLIGSLRDGESVEFCLRLGSSTAIVLLQPWWIKERDDGNGKKALLWVSYEHDQALEKNLKIMTIFHIADSVDIPRIAMDTVDLLPPQFCNASVSMKQVLSEISFCGRSSTAASFLYRRFTHFIQNSHRYGFEPSRRHNKWSGERKELPDPILMACAHCYILPAEKSSYHALELVWHTSPHYMPNKLSEQHETADPQTVGELLPKAINGFYYGNEEFSCGRQWWCPQSSTRLSVAPVLSPPTTLKKWCAKQIQADITRTAENMVPHSRSRV